MSDVEPRPAFESPVTLCGPSRLPRQLLGEQVYDGHTSIHDDRMAKALGFDRGPIEGPTHFSQFDPLAVTLWGRRWFETGCISAHFVTPVFEGDAVRARVTVPHHGSRSVQVEMEKDDGTTVLTGTASVDGSGHTEAERRLASARPVDRLVILDRLAVGARTPAENVRIPPHEALGPLYPFSLAEKLDVITEPLAWYEGPASPWPGAVLPFEMVSVLSLYTSEGAFPVRQPSVGLLVDVEVRLLHGPLLADAEYALEREIVALGESRRTESYWARCTLRDRAGVVVATTLIHNAFLKESYPDYPSSR